MTVSARVLAHSIGPYPESRPLITMQVTMHRFVLAEFNTHRLFSRNFRSSRAVPVHKMLAEVRDNPALPVTWRANKPGMQGGSELEGGARQVAEREWRLAALDAADRAEALMNAGLHKSWANRVLEPYLYVHGVVTSTEWSNFFALRRHPDAQPEIRHLADLMWEAQQASTPQVLQPGQWHLPFFDVTTELDRLPARPVDSAIAHDDWFKSLAIKLSVARCARVSYLTTEGKKPTIEEDLALYERLVGSTPKHSSPCEHQATPDRRVCLPENITANGGQVIDVLEHATWEHPEWHGNLRTWVQHRKTLLDECL